MARRGGGRGEGGDLPPRFEEERARVQPLDGFDSKSRDHGVVIRRLNHDPSAKTRKKALLAVPDK